MSYVPTISGICEQRSIVTVLTRLVTLDVPRARLGFEVACPVLAPATLALTLENATKSRKM